MFKDFARVWTPVLLAAELRESKPSAVRVADTPIVLFRDADGAPRAMLDRCPHRGVALSLGPVKDGCISCPFHGWRFDAEGAVRDVPWNPDAKIAQLAVPTFPAAEAAGLVWIYTAPRSALASGEPPTLHVADVFARPDLRVTGLESRFATHWTRAMENMLDWPHLPFVHARSIGKGLSGRARARTRMDICLEETSWGFRSTIALDGRAEPGALDFRFPNVMVLTIPVPDRTLVLMSVCVPVDAQSTRLLVVSGRDFLRPRLFDRFFNRTNRPILLEDRAVVESSWPAEVPHARNEASVRTDAPTLLFRKRYYAELRAREVTPEGRVARASSAPRDARDKHAADGP